MDLIKASLSDFDLFFSEIEKSFVLDERRDYNDALTLFKNGKYEILHLVENGERVGFLTVWTFSDFTFAEHFVVYEKYRNLGYGAMALESLKKVSAKIVLEAVKAQNDAWDAANV